MNDLSALLVPILIVLPIFDWIASAMLMRLSRRQPELVFLRERAISAVILSITTTVFALIFLNTSLSGGLFTNDWAKLLGRLATLILAAGPIIWVITYLRSIR